MVTINEWQKLEMAATTPIYVLSDVIDKNTQKFNIILMNHPMLNKLGPIIFLQFSIAKRFVDDIRVEHPDINISTVLMPIGVFLAETKKLNDAEIIMIGALEQNKETKEYEKRFLATRAEAFILTGLDNSEKGNNNGEDSPNEQDAAKKPTKSNLH